MCTKTCPCKITDRSKFPDLKTWKNKNLNVNGYTEYMDCPTETLSDAHKVKYAGLLRALETQFNCAGICDVPKFYLFSNINKG